MRYRRGLTEILGYKGGSLAQVITRLRVIMQTALILHLKDLHDKNEEQGSVLAPNTILHPNP